VIDAPGGGGKIPLIPNYVKRREGKKWIVRNYKGGEYTYTEPDA
jgi:lysine 2,3-aminomutase